MSNIQITGKKISEFSLADSIDGTEEIPFVKNGANGKMKASLLKGQKGDTGKSAYQSAQEGGFTGTEQEFASALAKFAEEDGQVLNNLAFYIDVNKASSLGSTRVDVGGNMGMRQMWEDSAVSVLMDANGNYCKLNRDDNRYTAEGDYLLNEDGTIVSAYANCDFMKIIPQTYGRVQTVTVGATTIQRLWLSLVSLPGGFIIPEQVVGKFKASNVSGKMRSLPGYVPDNAKTINAFFNLAQARSKNHGLANLDFRNYLLWHMMSKYAYRDSQNCKGSDGTLVWGVGLDGTESTSVSDKFTAQKGIKTGSTLSLGDYDGNMANVDANSQTVHSVNVAGFENPWGQYWEMVQGLCSLGTDVYCWRSNFMPTGKPTAETFANVEKVILTRQTAVVSPSGMNIITSDKGQGVYMITKQMIAGISYGDLSFNSEDGQLWRVGGGSYDGAACGLAAAHSNSAFSRSLAAFSARLAYYGDTTEVSAKKLAELNA